MVNTLYIAAAGTVSLDMRDAGNVVNVVIASDDAAVGAAELSFNSTASLTTNDTTGTIAGVVLAGGQAGITAEFNMAEPVEVGERLFLHSTGTNKVRVFIYTDSKTVRPATRRR